MELELRRLEDLADSIVNDFAYMRAREEEMRDTNGKQVRSGGSPSIYWNVVVLVMLHVEITIQGSQYR